MVKIERKSVITLPPYNWVETVESLLDAGWEIVEINFSRMTLERITEN